MLDAAELTARLTLRALPGLRDRAINKLIMEHGSAIAALSDPFQLILAGASGMPDAAVLKRVNALHRTIDDLGVHVLHPSGRGYPRRLSQHLKDHCPSLLFVMGDVGLLDDVSVAIVGSRAMSEYGRTLAEDFSRDLAMAGLTIISGLALGIDAVAHAATLDAGGNTIAVVGNGIDITYPRSNARLRERIIANGALVSQFLPGDRPTPYNFPERNLVMAALAEAVLVVEAGERSGAIITANHGAAFSLAMAVPGAIGRPTSAGTNQLIRDGAICVTSPAHVLADLNRSDHAQGIAAQHARREAAISGRSAISGRAARNGRSAGPPIAVGVVAVPEAVAVRRALAAGVCDLDDIATQTGLPVAVLLSTLLQLELDGVVRQHAGSRYELRSVSSSSMTGSAR